MSIIDDDGFQDCDICHQVKPMILIVQKLHLAICDDCLVDQYVKQQARIVELEKEVAATLKQYHENQDYCGEIFTELHKAQAQVRELETELEALKAQP